MKQSKLQVSEFCGDGSADIGAFVIHFLKPLYTAGEYKPNEV